MNYNKFGWRYFNQLTQEEKEEIMEDDLRHEYLCDNCKE